MPPPSTEARHPFLRDLVSRLAVIFALLLLAGFLGACLVRYAPGFNVDESTMDVRLSAESRQALLQQRAGEQRLFPYYVNYLRALLRGDLGESRTLQRPVTELLMERLPLTASSIGIGLLTGWLAGFGLALLNARFPLPFVNVISTMLTGAVVSVPIAVIALLFLLAGANARYAIGIIIFPNVFRFSSNLLSVSGNAPHVVTARAKGISRLRTLFMHVVAPVGPQLLALFAVTVSVALSASIAVEAMSDSPGIGQLAWQAAQARDLPVLVNLTLVVTAVTLFANGAAELINRHFGTAAG